MNTELLVTLAVLLILFGGLDYLIQRLRLTRDAKSLPLLGDLLELFNRLIDWFEHLQVSFTPPQTWIKNLLARRPTPKVAMPASLMEPAASQAGAKPASSLISSLEYEIPAAAGKIARVQINAEVPPDTVLQITISTDKEGRASVQQNRSALALFPPKSAFRRPNFPNLQPLLKGLAAIPAGLVRMPAVDLARLLFSAALGIYLLTRLIGLTDFPIYFFGDEAIQTTTASDLLQNGLRGPGGVLLPTYFQNGLYFNLSASVYLQVIPQFLFGKSIFVTRATSVLITLLAALCTGLMLRNFFGAKRWWLATLFLSVTPAWFLHSRTAFETALFVSFYSAFLYFYLDYRLNNPQRVYWAVIFAGLAFYSYSPGQLVLAATGVLLFFSDLKYHWQQRKTLLAAIGLLALVALPYLRFRLTNEYSPLDHLRSLGSYLIQPIPVTEKIAYFLGQYAHGLSPSYWFFDSPDMARHQMRGYGNIPLWFAPFMLIGTAAAFWRVKSPAQRLLIIAALTAPTGAALAEIGITRILVFVIPASLLAAIGLDLLLGWIENLLARLSQPNSADPVPGNLLAIIAFTVIATFNIHMLSDALTKGPTWYPDYGLYGMQYGAKQVYLETGVPALEADPQARFVVTPSWANGAEHFVGFFVPPALQSRVMLGQVYDLLTDRPALTDKDYFLVTYQEFDTLINDPKFKEVIVRSTIPYPDGRIGFYVLNIKLADDIEAQLAAEEVARRTPVEETVEWMGQSVRVLHSPLGGGLFQHLIDGDTETLAKGDQANPIIYELFFSQPLSATELVLTTGSMKNFQVIVQVYPTGSTTPVSYTQTFTGLADDPTINIPFTNGPTQFDHVFLSIKDNNQGEIAQVHVREISFK